MGLFQDAINHPMDTANIFTSLWPTIAMTGQSFRMRNDPLLNQTLDNRVSQYNNAMQGGGPFADPYGGYGMFGQFSNGQNISPFQGSFFNTTSMLNNPFNPTQMYQNNLLGLQGMQQPGMQDTTGGLANMLGRPSQFPQSYSPQNPPMQGSLVQGGTQAGQGASPGQGPQYPQEPLDRGPRPIEVWWQNLTNQQQGGPQMPPNTGTQLNQPPASPYQQLQQNPSGGTGQVTQGVLSNPTGGGTGNVTQAALQNPTGGTTGLLGNITRLGQQGNPQSVQNALRQQNAGLVSNDLVEQAARQGTPSLTQRISNNPMANTTGLLGNIEQAGTSGTPSLMQQIQNSPTSMGQDVQNKLYQQGADQIARQTQDLQRQMMEQANASGRFTGGGLDRAMMETGINRIGQQADLRSNIGIEAAKTNFNDLLNSSQAQQGDLSRRFGQLMGAGQFGQGINQQQFQNLATGAGIQQQAGQNMFGNRLNAAQFGQQQLNDQFGQGLQTAGLGLNAQQQQLQNALSAGGFDQNQMNNLFNQRFQTAGLQQSEQQRQFQNQMNSAGLEQGDMQRQFQNLLNTNQFNLGAEGQLAQQQLAQNQQNLGAYQQQFGNNANIASQLFGAGQAGEQRNLGLWDRLTGSASQGMNYNDQLLQQIMNQRANMIAPMTVPSSPGFTTPVGSSGGGGGGGNDWLPGLAELAGQFAGSYFG